jgi:hypothetical protein
MALDKNFERFAFSLQSEGNLEAGLTSNGPRPDCYRYKVVNRLSELKPILDDLYEGFKRDLYTCLTQGCQWVRGGARISPNPFLKQPVHYRAAAP